MDDYAPMAAAPQEPPATAPQQATALANPLAAQQFFSDPRAMFEVAKMAAQNRQGDTLKWLAMGHRAVQENAIEATQHLLAGDGDAAIAAFNKSGRFNDAQSAAKNDDGTWTLTRKNGQRMTIDPNQIMRSFLSPKDFADAANQDAQRRIQQQNADTAEQQMLNQRDYHKGVLEHYERGDESQAALREAQAEKARTAFAHQLELAGVRSASAAEVARIRNEGRAKLADPEAPAKLRAKLLESGPLAQQFADDPAKLTQAVEFTVRDAFTQTLPRRDGKGIDVVTTVGGEPVVLGNYPNIEAAQAAKMAFVTGKVPPAPQEGKPAPKKARTLQAPPPAPPQPPPLNITANEVWGEDPNERRRRELMNRPPVPGAKWIDVGN